MNTSICCINKDEMGTVYRSRRRQRTQYHSNNTRDTPGYVTLTLKGVNIVNDFCVV